MLVTPSYVLSANSCCLISSFLYERVYVRTCVCVRVCVKIVLLDFTPPTVHTVKY